ncbi:MAG: dephospho-CoA kinase [Bacteroidetes bacterium]|nr:dephospho-CoA kinase [Bacteroidota bacterium]
MKKIGLTGNMGSGKTTVAKIFEQLGVSVYSSDERAKKLMVENSAIIKGLTQLLGDEAYTPDGQLNRTYISSKIFNSNELLEGVNAIVHPIVFSDFDTWLQSHQSEPYILKEAAIMFESDSYKKVDKVIIVTAPDSIRIERCMKRDHASYEEVSRRMSKQMPQCEKEKLANYIINNDETELLIPQVLKLDALFRA